MNIRNSAREEWVDKSLRSGGGGYESFICVFVSGVEDSTVAKWMELNLRVIPHVFLDEGHGT